jgi:hypothetical protein
LIFPVAEVILSVAAVIIALLALNLRRALVDRPYRARALWTAVGALTLVSLFLANYADSIYLQGPATNATLTAVVVETIVWGFTFLGLFGWIVSNANVAIEADYFNRDVLGWKRGGMMASAILIIGLFIFYNFPPWLEPVALANGTGWGYAVNVVLDNLSSVVVVYAALVILISYRRINDMRIKTFTKWVVASISSLFLLFIVPSSLAFAPAILWVFCMYRSVGSLAIKVRSLEK